MNNYNYSIVLPYRDKYELFLKAIDSNPIAMTYKLSLWTMPLNL